MKIRALLLAFACLAPIAAHGQGTPNVPSSGPGVAIGTVAGTARDAAAAITAETGAAASATAAAAQNGVNANAYLVCDGVTDNATNIANWQAAIAASPGKAGYIPPQTAACMTSANLQPVSGETLAAVPGTVILKAVATSSASPVLLNVTGVSNVLIYGVTFDGNLSGVTGTELTANVLQFYNSSNVVLDHVTVQNTRGIGLEVSTSMVNSGVRDSYFYNVGMYWQTSGSNSDQQQAIAFSSGSGNLNNFVTGTWFNLTGLDAISFGNQTSPSAKDNRFYQVGGRTSNGGACVYGSTNSNVHISGNTCLQPYGNGYDLIYSTGFNIGANSVQKAGGSGIQVSSSSQGVIAGNESVNGNQSGNTGTTALDGGIAFGGPNSFITVTGNTSTDNQGTPTQQSGIEFLTSVSTSCVSCQIDKSNVLSGNAVGQFAGGAGFSLGSQVFSASGTFVISPNATVVCHLDVGAGGGAGGGGVIASGSGSGGGGGGAGTMQGPICKPASSYSSPVTVTIGAGGAGGASAANGSSGTQTQFGSDPAAFAGAGGGSGGSGRLSAGGLGSSTNTNPTASNGASLGTGGNYQANGGGGALGSVGYSGFNLLTGTGGSGSGATGAGFGAVNTINAPSGGASGGGFNAGTGQAGGSSNYSGLTSNAGGAANASGVGGAGAAGVNAFPFGTYATTGSSGGGAGSTTGGAGGGCPTGGAGMGGSGGGAGVSTGGAGAAGCPGAMLVWQY